MSGVNIKSIPNIKLEYSFSLKPHNVTQEIDPPSPLASDSKIEESLVYKPLIFSLRKDYEINNIDSENTLRDEKVNTVCISEAANYSNEIDKKITFKISFSIIKWKFYLRIKNLNTDKGFIYFKVFKLIIHLLYFETS